jgi:hypothetical protein
MTERYDDGDLKICIRNINVFCEHADGNFLKPPPKSNSKYFNTQ